MGPLIFCACSAYILVGYMYCVVVSGQYTLDLMITKAIFWPYLLGRMIARNLKHI